jgi:integrase
MFLEDRFGEFLESCRGQSEHSRRNYEQRLKGFLQLHGGKSAADIRPADINAWHRDLQRRRLAPATLAGYRQAIKALFNHCVEVGDIAKSPAAHLAIGSFASSRAQKLPFEPDVQRVTEHALGWLMTDSPQRVRDALIWLLSHQSGPRLGEIRNLLLEDVTLSLRAGPDAYGVYRVPTTGKTGRVSIRYAENLAVAFNRWIELRPTSSVPELFTTIRSTRPTVDGKIGIRALTPSAATQIYGGICSAAGVSPPILSHALRHRLGHTTTQQFGPKVAAILLNHRDWQQSSTAIAFYHHPDETDASRAIISTNVGNQDETELHHMRRLFGLED